VASARESKKVVAADPNPRNNLPWHGLSVVKPNRSEAFHAAGIPLPESDGDDKVLKEVGATLLQKWAGGIGPHHSRGRRNDAFPTRAEAASRADQSAAGL
jgi:hypothetical protein